MKSNNNIIKQMCLGTVYTIVTGEKSRNIEINLSD